MILVFGKTGQMATELHRMEGMYCVGRDVADLADPDSCAAVIERYNPEAVINAAAYTAVDAAEKEEPLASIVNGVAPGAMARAAAKLGIPLVHVSTDYVFDGSGDAPRAPGDPTDPLGAYGRTKLAGEHAVLAARGRSVVLRTSWVFSAHGSNFLKTMLRLSESRDQLNIVADQIGGPTPARALAETSLSITRQLISGQSTPGIHHYAGAPNVSWAEFARATFEAAGRQIEVIDIPSTDYPTPAARPLNGRLDCSSLKQAFGIDRPDWRKAVGAIVEELESS